MARNDANLPFRFTAEMVTDWSDDDPLLYAVYLPHQCDEFYVACERDKDTAIARVEAFIVAAANALAKLKALP